MKYIIALNKHKNIDDQHDFFTKEEFNEIVNMLKEIRDKYDYEIIDDEHVFLKTMSMRFIEKNEYTVLNLTRRGSYNNKKVVVTAYCDIRNIKCIASSAFTVNICRNKRLFPKLFSFGTVFFPKSFSFSDLKTLYETKTKVILKKNQSAGSEGLLDSNCGVLEKSNNAFTLNSNKITNKIASEYIIQEYIQGMEVEVPFIIKDGCVEILGIYEIYNIKNKDNIITSEISDSFDYDFRKVQTINEKYIYFAVNRVIEVLSINYYGRVDFKIGDINDIKSYKIFDIATTPYFTKNTSFQIAFKENEKYSDYKNVIDLILSL